MGFEAASGRAVAPDGGDVDRGTGENGESEGVAEELATAFEVVSWEVERGWGVAGHGCELFMRWGLVGWKEEGR